MDLSCCLLIFSAIVDRFLQHLWCANLRRADISQICPLGVLASTILAEKSLGIFDDAINISLWLKLSIYVHLTIQRAKYLIIDVSNGRVPHCHHTGCRLAVERKVVLGAISDLLIRLVHHSHFNIGSGFLFVPEIVLLVEILVNFVQLVEYCRVKSLQEL